MPTSYADRGPELVVEAELREIRFPGGEVEIVFEKRGARYRLTTEGLQDFKGGDLFAYNIIDYLQFHQGDGFDREHVTGLLTEFRPGGEDSPWLAEQLEALTSRRLMLVDLVPVAGAWFQFLAVGYRIAPL